MKYLLKINSGRLFAVAILLFVLASPALAEVLKKTDSSGNEKSAVVEAAVMKKSEQEKILSRIRQKYSLKDAYAGSFTQKTTYTDSNETTLSTGQIWIQGPDKMRWEYQLPEKQLLVSDGQTLWYYTPDLNQVMVGKIKDIKEARVIVNLLAKLKAEPKNLKLHLSREDNLITVVLLPLDGDKAPAFQNLKIIFAADTLMLLETRMEDLFANKIVISYKWKSGPDPILPAAHFSFIPPAGCDVMRLGQ
jgi:outer membrane lipoprotein carrier protein